MAGRPCMTTYTSRIREIVKASAELSLMLDEYVDESGMWVGIPKPYPRDKDENDVGRDCSHPDGLTCSFCGHIYCPLDNGDGTWGEALDFTCYQLCMDARGWMAWPVCSTECCDALQRQFRARSRRSKSELRELWKARRLLKEVKRVIQKEAVGARR